MNGDQAVTLYSWKDMVGLSSITYSSGQVETYTYDSHNRLSDIFDSDNHKLIHIEGNLSSELNGKSSKILQTTYLDSNMNKSRIDIEYYDGLGRKAFNLALGDSNAYPSIAQSFTYDNMGRSDAMSYLPYTIDNANLNVFDDIGSYNWHSDQKNWYYEHYNDSTRTFVERRFEPWKGGRLLSEQNAGMEYERENIMKRYYYITNSNSDNVMKFSLSIPSLDSVSVNCTGKWSPFKLRKQITISEECDTTVIFSDSFGKVLLSRQINKGINHDTYYIRDGRDSVVLVIQPEGSKRLVSGTSYPFDGIFVHDYCFGYLYDGYGRLEWKHCPGDGGTRYAYDQRNRLAFSDDANLRNQGKGRYYLYDNYDRLIEDGLCEPLTSMSAIRDSLVNGVMIQTVTSARQDIRKRYYRTNNSDTLIPNDMCFAEVQGIVASSDINTSRNKHKLEYECLREISDSIGAYTRKAYWYNAQGRLIQMLEKTSDGWMSRYSTKYDFVGNPIKYYEQHTNPSGETHTLLIENTYDNRGRITRCIRTLNGVSLDPIEYCYDDLGRLSTKTLNNTNGTYKLRQTIDRNLLGWISDISVTHPIEGTLFDESIAYRFDGLIDEITTHNGPQGGTSTPVVRNKYTYDHLGRLLGNNRWVDNVMTDVGTEKNIQYDLNGNITYLKRNLNGVSDNIYFAYQGNIITAGCINPETDFIDIWGHSDDNGNLKFNLSEGTSVSYNFLNLPSLNNGFKYTYLPDGTKMSVGKDNGNKTLYRGNFIFSQSPSGNVSLESVAYTEGRIYADGADLVDCWNVKDHVGNVRSVINLEGGQPTILETNDYLPFGLRLGGNGFEDNMRWHFAEKEYQWFDSVDLSLIDFGARYYSPWLCRWYSIDPLAHKSFNLSPYVFCEDSPLSFTDYDGKRSIPLYKKFKQWGIKIDSWFGPRPNDKGETKMHEGLDFNYSGGRDTDKGSSILATHEGFVSVHKGTDGAGGRYVTITSPDNKVMTKYMHLDTILVEEGQYVYESDEIGTMGYSGFGSDHYSKYYSHLHYELWIKHEGKWMAYNPSYDESNTIESIVDPQAFLDYPYKSIYLGELDAAVIDIPR